MGIGKWGMMARMLVFPSHPHPSFLLPQARTLSSLPPLFHRFAAFCSSSSASLSPPQQPPGPAQDNGDIFPRISVDRSGLYSAPEHSHDQESDTGQTPMAKHIEALIRFRGGPITVAEFMEEVLTNPTAGFYMNRDVFGSSGDFVTSPEISQMFGELLGVWSMCLWQQMGQPTAIQLIELGPGRGTLMADLLRGTAKFREFAEAVSVHLIECSPTLRKIQQQTLKCTWESGRHKLSEGDSSGCSLETKDSSVEAISQLSGAHVSWHANLQQVHRGVPSIIISHEFFDALPIHQFQRTDRGWCEKLVDIAEGSRKGLRFVLSPGPTAASKLYLAKRFKWASFEEKAKLDHIEVCPQALQITKEIACRVGEDGGGALVIDYGEDNIISDSLQAIRKHKFVHVLENPGTADLSAYIDFAALKRMVEEAAVGALAFGPISQSQLLGMLGINFRLEALLKNASEEQANALQLGYWRLVGDGTPSWWEGSEDLAPAGMGSRYKALAIVNSSLGAPVSFQ